MSQQEAGLWLFSGMKLQNLEQKLITNRQTEDM